MGQLAEILVGGLILMGAAFVLIGSWGLVRLPSLMTRLHGPTKATTLGVGGILTASMIHSPLIEGSYSFHELLIALFLFITAPITANMIAKAHLHRQGRGIDSDPDEQIRDDLPMAQSWATFHGAQDEAPPQRDQPG